MDAMLQGLFASDAGYFGLLAIAAGFVIVIVLVLRQVLAPRGDALQDRLQRVVASDSGVGDQGAGSTTGTQESDSLLDRSVRTIAAAARPTNEEELSHLRGQLSHAGYRSEGAMSLYLTAKLGLGIGLTAAFLALNAVRAAPIQPAPLLTVVCMIVGFYLPNLWLSSKTNARQLEINRALPDTLDLLVTCVEAGLGLDAALNRVADEVLLSAPILGGELVQTGREMRAGASRGDAFRRLASRTGIEDLKALASVIVQSELFGTSVGASLRMMSDTMRVRRMQKAEKGAAQAGVKMTLPLILFILPSLLLILTGPAVVKVMLQMGDK